MAVVFSPLPPSFFSPLLSRPFFLNCVPRLWQMAVICLCELPITQSVRDTYHSEWGCIVQSCNTSSLLSPLSFLPFFSPFTLARYVCSSWLSPWFIIYESPYFSIFFTPLQNPATPSPLLQYTPHPSFCRSLFFPIQSHSLCNLGVHRTILLLLDSSYHPHCHLLCLMSFSYSFILTSLHLRTHQWSTPFHFPNVTQQRHAHTHTNSPLHAPNP